MNVTYEPGSTHNGHNFEKGVIVNQGMSLEDVEALKACVKQYGVSREDIDRLIEVLNNINLSHNDFVTEFTKMVVEQKDAQKKGTVKKLSEGVTLTNGMIALGKTAVGIATNNPAIALPAALEMVKEVAK